MQQYILSKGQLQYVRKVKREYVIWDSEHHYRGVAPLREMREMFDLKTSWNIIYSFYLELLTGFLVGWYMGERECVCVCVCGGRHYLHGTVVYKEGGWHCHTPRTPQGQRARLPLLIG